MIKTTWRNKDRSLYAKIRVFVSGEDEPSWEHPPYGYKGDDVDDDRCWRRYNKEERRLQREVITEALAADDELAIKLGDPSKLRWSRKAGCACGCSPGWIAEGRGVQDVFIGRIPDDPPFAVGDRVEHVDGRVGDVTHVSTNLAVEFDGDSVKRRHFAWNKVHVLTKTARDPNEGWLHAGSSDLTQARARAQVQLNLG